MDCSRIFDEQGDTLAAPDTVGRDTITEACAFELARQRECGSNTARAQRMATHMSQGASVIGERRASAREQASVREMDGEGPGFTFHNCQIFSIDIA
jgi:hypothetical protein